MGPNQAAMSGGLEPRAAAVSFRVIASDQTRPIAALWRPATCRTWLLSARSEQPRFGPGHGDDADQLQQDNHRRAACSVLTLPALNQIGQR